MAFVNSKKRGASPAIASRKKSTGIGRAIRWLAVPGIGLALTAWSVATVSSLYSARSLAQPESFVTLHRAAKIGPGDPRNYAVVADAVTVARAGAAIVARQKANRPALAAPTTVLPLGEPALKDPFAEIVAQVSRDRMLAALAHAGLAISQPALDAAAAHQIVLAYRAGEPVDVILELPRPQPERFGPPSLAFGPGALDPQAPLAIARTAQMTVAYAMTPAAAPEASWGSLARFLDDREPPDTVEVAAAALPKSSTLPGPRPKAKPLASARPSKQAENPEARELAFVRPDKPADAKPFNKLFKRQDGVAIYDISAGTVYMPDDSKLEAHSGIGKMADNPRYVHVKNAGPTPPNTYQLSMRETRFFGVEAIRMTPTTGKPMHGRDGFLTHSYLLRSRAPESHGCVAFKNYPLFLKAFKQGKVKQLVVVPSLKDVQAPKPRSERGA